MVLRRILFVLTVGLSLSVDALFAMPHEGPDPIAHWIFNPRTVGQSKVEARLGPAAAIEGEHQLIGQDQGLLLSGDQSRVLVTDDYKNAADFLPQKSFTISTRFSINERIDWGGVIGAFQDNGNYEKGWVLGYDARNFFIALSTTDADDGDGMMTYLKGQTDYELGKYYHVVAVFDGELLQLFVDGKLDAETSVQGGDILYPEKAPVVIGAYQDDDEFFPHTGRIYDIAIYDMAAKPEWVKQEFDHLKSLAQLTGMDSVDEPFGIVVPPYLQSVSTSQITIGWQTSKPATTFVRYGETIDLEQNSTGIDGKMIHHVTLDGLKPNTQYFYSVGSKDSSGETVSGDVLTFQTACGEESPYAFAIISDTQGNPEVAGKVAEMAWAQRPSFLIHPGDLVSTGTNDSHWTRQFFPAMAPLIGRVPIFPVLGNHEVNARNYYDYFDLPTPEYYYDFKYGNAHFFMLDTNKRVDPESEQYQWLEESLKASQSKWKFVVHHHPVYSSDENDYGNLWKTNQSTRGDARVRVLAELYDKYHVDIVWNGHIHSYERTWPIHRNAATTSDKGTVYMVTGGGGGGLETPGPFRPFFQNNVKRGHHYCMAYVNGDSLEFKAFDLEGRLFDSMTLQKRKVGKPTP